MEPSSLKCPSYRGISSFQKIQSYAVCTAIKATLNNSIEQYSHFRVAGSLFHIFQSRVLITKDSLQMM